MSRLTDMEELITKIPNIDIREYMKEALSCYMASAYRGCITLSYIALFDDLYNKLEGLSTTNSKAKQHYQEVKKRRESQDVYENYLN